MGVLLAKERILKLIQVWDENQIKSWRVPELLLQLLDDLRTINESLKQREEKRIEREQAANLAVQEEQEEQAAQNLPTEEPDTSLSMGDEHLDTNPEMESDEHFVIFSNFNDDSNNNDSIENIDYVEASSLEDSLIIGNEELSSILEKESDEFIKSSVEDLVPIPSESEYSSRSDSENVLPFDDESLSDEDVSKDNVKTYSNPLFEFNDEYISSDVNLLFDEVLKEIECKVSYDSNLDESTFLVTPLSDSNVDEFFTPSNDVELLLHHDPSISVVSILQGFFNEPPPEENDDLFDLESKENDWKKILYDAPIDDLITEDK
ncbi:hypothetical protein Tco_0931502, partial [Tanacetum coccineum]